MKRIFDLILVVLLAAGITGCSGIATIRQTGPNTVVIQISQAPTGNTPQAAPPVQAPPNPSVQPEPNPAIPPTATNTPPPTNTPAAPVTTTQYPGQAAALQELRDVYNISIAGSPNDESIRNTLVYARQHRPADIKDVNVTFSNESAGGVLGQWTPRNTSSGPKGMITIFNAAKNDMVVIGHELTHHLTIFSSRRQSAQVAQQLTNQVGTDDPRRWPNTMITRSYALTQWPELVAELFSNYVIIGRNLTNQRPLTPISRNFNPPAEFRPTMEQMYLPVGA